MTADENHISYEKQGVVSENIYLIVIFVGLIAFSCRNMTQFNLEFDLLFENTPTLYCMVAMAFQLLGLVLDLIHWSKYAQDGKGSLSLEVLGNICEMGSEVIMTLVVLMLTNGWMTLDLNQEEITDDLYIPIGVIVLVVHFCLGSLVYVDRDAHHKYHDYNGWQGYVLIAVKIILACVQVYFYLTTRKIVTKNQLKYLDMIFKIGLVYLLSDPMVIMSSFFLEEINRQYYYRFLDQGIHIFTQFFLLY
jgi:hypothetical protein